MQQADFEFWYENVGKINFLQILAINIQDAKDHGDSIADSARRLKQPGYLQSLFIKYNLKLYRFPVKQSPEFKEFFDNFEYLLAGDA